MESDGACTISAHRAFILSAGAPGAGDVYAGFRPRGYTILALFIGFSGWLIWILAAWLATAVESLFGNMDAPGTPAIPQIPVVSIGAAFLILFLIWCGAVLSAVDVTVRQRRSHGNPPQASVAWALAMSWLCPGTGQVYTGQRILGLTLFTGYIISMSAIGLSADGGFISVPAADHLEWLSVIIQWAAAIEAPLAMKKPLEPAFNKSF